jgi:hypothetical protein
VARSIQGLIKKFLPLSRAHAATDRPLFAARLLHIVSVWTKASAHYISAAGGKTFGTRSSKQTAFFTCAFNTELVNRFKSHTVPHAADRIRGLFDLCFCNMSLGSLYYLMRVLIWR